MPSSPDTSPPDPHEEREVVHGRLLTEFDRLDRAHFDGTLVLEELVVSLRKQYGGYREPHLAKSG